MSIPVVCGGCGKRFQAPERGAGKKVPCPACKTTIVIPALIVVEEEEEYRLADEEPTPLARLKMPAPARPAKLATSIAPAPPAVPQPAPAAAPSAQAGWSQPASTAPQAASVPAAGGRGWVPPTKSSTPPWLRHLHWCLALATIPLAISIFLPDESPDEFAERLVRSLTAIETPGAPAADSTPPSAPGAPADIAASPSTDSGSASADETAGLDEMLNDVSLDELLLMLPGHKLQGAFLARDSYLHWLFAFVSVAAYLTFFVFLASDKSANALHLLGIGSFTATIGILLLLVVQALSTIGLVGARGIVGLILLVLALIGMSYNMALNPDSGLVASFIGFTCGVGLCEELCKAIPMLIYYRIGNSQTWRGAFLWGLASGAGFGVSEGIMYSQDFYNGMAGPGIYVVRFVSCVALHAIWSGSVGISINQRQYLLQEDYEEGWWMYALAVLRMIAIPMVLHGLYDTLLKKDLDFLALATAAASFGYLAWQISRLRTSDDEDERAAYVGQFIRSKVLAARGQA